MKILSHEDEDFQRLERASSIASIIVVIKTNFISAGLIDHGIQSPTVPSGSGLPQPPMGPPLIPPPHPPGNGIASHGRK